ncbi:hypothetical protein ATCC90586_004512 [Pythium insidiosum]|nr:hypothetical protein ATCC90586_004512 [Pythium insidiosum]
MIETGYFLAPSEHARPEESELLTSFCMSAVPSHQHRVERHFERYARFIELECGLPHRLCRGHGASRHSTKRHRRAGSRAEQEAKGEAEMSAYNDWEADLSSIIEKTNQNLKLLRRIGDKRADFAGAYDVSTTTPSAARPPSGATGAAQIASDLRSFAANISNRYATEDLAAAGGTHLENKLQALEKSMQSDRIDAVASLKSEVAEDMERMEQRSAKKAELTDVYKS